MNIQNFLKTHKKVVVSFTGYSLSVTTKVPNGSSIKNFQTCIHVERLLTKMIYVELNDKMNSIIINLV